MAKTSKTPDAQKMESSFSQKLSDEEILDKAKINALKLDRLTMQKIVDAIIKFAELLQGFPFYPYQREVNQRILYSLIIADGETITQLFSRQSGKSTGISGLIVAMSVLFPILGRLFREQEIRTHIIRFEKGFFTGVYAPDYDRSAIIGNKVNNIFKRDEAREILSDPDIGMRFPERLSYYLSALPHNSIIKVKSADPRVAIEGDTYHLVVTDETQLMNDTILKKSISPMLSSTLGTTVHLGSVHTEKSYFYDIIKMNKDKDMNKKRAHKNHYEVDYILAGKYNKYYRRYVEKEKEKLGEFSDEFQMSYCLKWLIESGMFVTEEYLLSLGGDFYTAPFDRKKVHVIGVDIAKKFDSTVVTVLEVDWDNPILIDSDSRLLRHDKKIKNWLELSGDDYDAQFYQICEFIDNYKWDTLVVDATGVGAPMFDRLKNKYSSKNVMPFVFSTQSKSTMYSLLYKELLAKRLTFPNSSGAKQLRKWKNFITQLSNMTKNVKNGYLVVNHSSEQGHDDYPDSLALAVYGVETKIDDIALETQDSIYSVSQFDKNFWR